MNKKLVSGNNPQGVEYPEAVTADGKLVSAIDIEKGSATWEGVKFYFPGCETDEEEEMLFIQRKHKNGVTKFFRHRPGYIGDRNESDRYLHNYAELRLKERFDESQETGCFPIQYYVIEKCPSEVSCKQKKFFKCNGSPKVKLKTLNLRDKYDTCTLEKGIGKYIADLIFSNSKNRSVKPLVIEVFVTHKCSEEKQNSDIPIIEIKIEKKEDAESNIVENAGAIMNEFHISAPVIPAVPQISFYGFNRKAFFNNFLQLETFKLFRKGNEMVSDYNSISCNENSIFSDNDCVLSLSAPKGVLDGDICTIGMAIAHQRGLSIRNCEICERRSKTKLISCIAGRLNSDNEFDKRNWAPNCDFYSISEHKINKIIQNLKNKNIYLWVDDNSQQIQITRGQAHCEVSK